MARYQIGDVIGVGGMGEVLLAHDTVIGRDVAIKRLRTDRPDPVEIERFVREVKIQARLEHPAIVPVHELAHDTAGRPYFTMKRLAGTTLYEIIEANTQPVRQILRAFVDVCLAVEFAHARGIVHRDLKPANVMLGDFGEVYVLDWGLARALHDPDPTERAGTMFGTPGYASPEQIRSSRDVGPPADVYALGAILFEILTGARLHPDGDAGAHTLAAPTIAPLEHAPDREIPPELDGACVAALAFDPAIRPTARALADRISAYLDGDRDLERRRALSREHLAIAREAIATNDPDRRVLAIRAANHALALDPQSSDAAATAIGLVMEPPTVLPVKLTKHLHDREMDIVAKQANAAALALATPLAFWPVAVGLGVTNWVPMLVGTVLILGMVGLTFSEAKRRRVVVWPWIIADAFLVALFCRICGPWTLVPALAVGLGMTLLGAPGIGERPWHVLAALVTGYLVPFVLEALGILAPTWSVHDGHLETWSDAFRWSGTAGSVFLVVGNLAVIVTVCLFARSLAESRRDAYRRVEIQRWHLAQLLPTA